MTDLAIVAHDLQVHLAEEIGFIVTNKETSDLMKATATGMDIIGVFTGGLPAGKDFMENFATTVAKEVFVPKIIRDNPLALMEVITHEAEHVYQWKDTNIEYAWFYATASVACGQFEADAYASGIAVRCWLTGQTPQERIPWVVDMLVKSYRLKPASKPYAEAALKSHFASISSGICMTRSGRVAIKFLETKYPELKGAVIG